MVEQCTIPAHCSHLKPTFPRPPHLCICLPFTFPTSPKVLCNSAIFTHQTMSSDNQAAVQVAFDTDTVEPITLSPYPIPSPTSPQWSLTLLVPPTIPPRNHTQLFPSANATRCSQYLCLSAAQKKNPRRSSPVPFQFLRRVLKLGSDMTRGRFVAPSFSLSPVGELLL